MWTREWPTAKGWYWFYGVGHKCNTKPHLRPAQVRHDATGTPMWICDGAFLHRGEGAKGWWLPLAEPELPADAGDNGKG